MKRSNFFDITGTTLRPRSSSSFDLTHRYEHANLSELKTLDEISLIPITESQYPMDTLLI